MNNELQIQIIQNLVPVLTADIQIGTTSGTSVVFGDTMTGAGTPSDPVNVSNDILQQISDNTEQGEQNASQIANIQDLVPATANANNQLADQGFVNSSIQTATAYFRGDWATWADVPSDPELYPVDATGNRTPTTNDYLVVVADEQTNGGTWRYKYTGLWSEQGKSGWQAEYQVNETPLTAAQLAALNSGVTAQAVADIATNKNNITGLQNGKQDKLTAGTNITIDGNTISASGGGDYLPLTGGVMTGAVEFKYDTTKNGCGFAPSTKAGFNTIAVGLFDKGVFKATVRLCSAASSHIIPTNDLTTQLGSKTGRWVGVYTKALNNGGEDLLVPTEGGTLARVEDITAIGGDGTAGQVLTKTDDGMAWQDASGGASLPDQAGNAGKFLQTDGTNIRWADALVNKTTSPGALVVGGLSSSIFGTAVGVQAATGINGTAIGYTSKANSLKSIAIGCYAIASANSAIQIGEYTNSDANTFKVGNANGNFEMMSADGTIPAARHAALPTEDGSYVLKLVIADGVPTMSWIKE